MYISNYVIKKNIVFFSLSILLAVFLIALLPAQAYGLDDITIKGLSISPIRVEQEIIPGTAKSGILNITNSSETSIQVLMSAEEFSVINQQYDYAFSPQSDIAKWVSFDENEYTLEKNESIAVKYSIDVPLSAEPGGRYISLFASTNADPNSAIQSSIKRVASLLFLNVSGDVSRIGKLININSPWLVFNEASWSANLQNSGSTHYRSRYTVQVKSIFGRVISSNINESLILPGSIRTIFELMPTPKLPGLYVMNYHIGLGDTPAVSINQLMLYLPSSSVGLFGLFLIFLMAVKKYFNKIN